jgi:U3 small nucleolar ribonucleoprotein protein IMP3
MGVVNTGSTLSQADGITVSAICRRRLPVIMVRLKMAETLREAMQYVRQGHVRVGPTIVTDSAFLVTRAFEDFVTWVDTSKIRKTIMKYNDKLDDYTLLGN